MTFKIHGEYDDGTTDSFIVEGETIEQIREEAILGTDMRGLQNCWSEEL